MFRYFSVHKIRNLKVYICVLVSQSKCLNVLLWHRYMHGDICAIHSVCH